MEGRRASSTRRATARCCRSCTSTATRSPARRCSAAPATRTIAAPARGPRLRRRTSSRATTRRRCTATSPPRSTRASTRSARSRRRPRRRVRRRAPRWPAIVLRTPKGWTGPEGGRRHADRGHVPRPPGAASATCATNPEHLAIARGVDAQLPARGAVRRATAGWCPSSPALAPEGDRRMGANPHANGGRLLVPLELPDFDDYALAGRRAGRELHESTRQLGEYAARHLHAQREARELPAVLPRRDELEPARRGVRGREPRADRADARHRRPRRRRTAG